MKNRLSNNISMNIEQQNKLSQRTVNKTFLLNQEPKQNDNSYKKFLINKRMQSKYSTLKNSRNIIYINLIFYF